MGGWEQEVIGKLRLLDIQFLGIAGAVSKIYFQMVQCLLLRSESHISITRSSLQTRSLPRLISSPPFPVPSSYRLSTSCRYLRLEEKKVMKKYEYLPVDVLGRSSQRSKQGLLSSNSNDRSPRKFQCSQEEISRSTCSWHMNNSMYVLGPLLDR